MGRPAGGVTGARFKREGDQVIDMIVIPGGMAGCCVLTACVNGYGKRTPLEDYPVKGRGTRGVINIDANERNGDVVSMKLVADNDEIMLMTEKGILIRTRVNEIRETGRNAAGVKLIRLDEGDRLVAMAKVEPDEESGEQSTPSPTDTPDAGAAPTATDGTPPTPPTGDGAAPQA
jgi:DNA gyrase subunit A